MAQPTRWCEQSWCDFSTDHTAANGKKSCSTASPAAPKDGQYPQAGLSFGPAGNRYGTTQYGGRHSLGTVFQLKPSNGKWTFKVIHAFAGGNGGYYPLGGLTAGKNGYYYGTTQNGGSTFNAGTVYRLFQARGTWVSQTVYLFTGGASGTYPQSSLTEDAAGNF
jgi:uncharacterized repeat protein (TIGR03803 family)